MKFYVLKSFLLVAALLTANLPAKAQFDDVYYDADLLDPQIRYTYDEPQALSPEDDVIYYDDDSYAYYDDYDNYYSTQIQRFYHPYGGFGYYDPVYVGFGIGFSFGFGSWYAPYYYPYNSWYYPSYSYWGGCGGYGGYYGGYYGGSYCNSYYPGHCGGGGYYPPPGYCGGGGGYYPPYYGDHYGDYYYGPRSSGNTGASPRGPQTLPGIVRTDVKSEGIDLTDSNEKPNGLPEPVTPGKVNPSGSPTPASPSGVKQDIADGVVRHVPADLGHTPSSPSGVKQDVADGIVRQIPIDRELPRGETPSGPKRPVFRPDAEKYQPYPTPSRPSSPSPGPQVADNPRPSTGGVRPTVPGSGYQPYPQAERQNDIESPGDNRPSAPPSSTRQDDRPRYAPPPRPEDRGDERPSYSPPQRNDEEHRNSDRPSSSAPPRSESQRSYDAPRQSSPSSGGHSSPSGGGSRPSGGSSGGGGGSSPSSSPRGRG